MSRTASQERLLRTVRAALVLAALVIAIALLWPREPSSCHTYGRAADYQSTPATIGTGVTCQG